MTVPSPALAGRAQRVQTAVALGVPDRVPFIPTFNNYYCLEYGVSIQEAMTRPLALRDALLQVLDRYEPDLVYLPTCFPIPAMEAAGSTAARWPGPHYGLPENTPYQYLDCQYLEDEDYDEFLADPTRFILQKVLPRKYSAYGGLALVEPFSLCHQSIYSQSVFGIPPVKAALEAMVRTGTLVLENLDAMAQLAGLCLEQGFLPFGSAVAMAPFDDFADHVRGLLTTCMDCIEEPERLAQALELWGARIIPASIASAKMQHAQYLFIPLHCGNDDFMSLENYEKFYWPGLKQLILAAIEAEITPMVICEGKYYTRLHTLADVPKGKVIYFFEDTDFQAAKEILGGVACIGGGMPTDLLMFGTPQEVADQTKKMLDLCAPGGGFIMTNSLALDQVKRENMDAWKETLFTYGQY